MYKKNVSDERNRVSIFGKHRQIKPNPRANPTTARPAASLPART